MLSYIFLGFFFVTLLEKGGVAASVSRTSKQELSHQRILLVVDKNTYPLSLKDLGIDLIHRRADPLQIWRKLQEVGCHLKRPSQEARITFTDKGLVLHPEKVGYAPNLRYLYREILRGLLLSQLPSRLQVPMIPLIPRVTAQHLKQIKGPIASFTTRYNPRDRNRTHNLKKVAERLNGAIVLPGEVFSFNQRVGPREPKYGYRVAKIYVRRRLTEGVGGGTCQVSSTLYNAVLLAGLKVVERHHHSLTVPYISPGRDATVAYGLLDFRFQNTTSAPLLIQARAKGGKLKIVLYGSTPPKEEIKVVTVIRRRMGKVWSQAYRIFKEASGVEKRELLSRDLYIPLHRARTLRLRSF